VRLGEEVLQVQHIGGLLPHTNDRGEALGLHNEAKEQPLGALVVRKHAGYEHSVLHVEQIRVE